MRFPFASFSRFNFFFLHSSTIFQILFLNFKLLAFLARILLFVLKMSLEHLNSQKPSSFVSRDSLESSSSLSSKSSSINFSADFLQRLVDRIQQSAQALKALASKFKSTQMASSSHQQRIHLQKKEPVAETLIPYN